MRDWQVTLLAALIVGLVATSVDLGTRNLLAAEPAQSAQSAQPDPDAVPDTPGPLETAGMFAGGMLIVVLAAAGLTITFRSLIRDVRGRRHRYRRRGRREPRDAGA